MRAENNLKLMCHYVRYYVDCMSRLVSPSDIVQNNVRALSHLKEAETTHEPPKKLPKVDLKDWPKTAELIADYLRLVLGEGKIPLNYVSRQTSDVKPAADDQPKNHDTPQQEITARAPHKNSNDKWLFMFA